MHSVDAFENLFIYNLAHEPKKENHDRLFVLASMEM